MDKQADIEMILSSVLGLYSRYGIKSITMDDVSRELGISKKTLYQFIRDKADLIGRVLDYERRLTKQYMDQLADPDHNAIDELIEVNNRIHTSLTSHNPAFYYDLKKYYPDLFKGWMKQRRHGMYTLLISNIRRGKQEGFYREDMDEAIEILFLGRIKA
jgi:AcrR family transcriptional regulator